MVYENVKCLFSAINAGTTIRISANELFEANLAVVM